MIIEKHQQLRIQDIPFSDENIESKADIARDFIRVFRNYHSAMKLASAQLEILDDEFASTYVHSPIHHMECRIKSPDSVAAKLNRKGHSLTIDNLQHINDIAGIRVVCNYTNDIYFLYRLIKKTKCFRMIRECDYIQSPKSNGYRSLHLVVSIPVIVSEGTIDLPVEIQLRSIAMDLWASLEHELRYKSDREFSMEDEMRLKKCAETLSSVEYEMQELFQNENNGKISAVNNKIQRETRGILPPE